MTRTDKVLAIGLIICLGLILTWQMTKISEDFHPTASSTIDLEQLEGKEATVVGIVRIPTGRYAVVIPNEPVGAFSSSDPLLARLLTNDEVPMGQRVVLNILSQTDQEGRPYKTLWAIKAG